MNAPVTRLVQMRHHRFMSRDPHGQHQLAYIEWGNSDNPDVVLCLHGLTRNSRDFDFLAMELASHYRVICLDIAGRGQSTWLEYPEDYEYSVYIHDVLMLLQHLKIDVVDVVGTSMGGIIGMSLAALPHSPVRRLILNDVGAVLPQPALARIAAYLNQPLITFNELNEVDAYIRQIHAPFGQLSDEQWAHLARYSVGLNAGGGYRFLYDPRIAATFRSQQDINLWSIWTEVECPVMLIWGEYSDLLTAPIVQQMRTSQPALQLVKVVNAGHAPALMSPPLTTTIKNWLLIEETRIAA